MGLIILTYPYRLHEVLTCLTSRSLNWTPCSPPRSDTGVSQPGVGVGLREVGSRLPTPECAPPVLWVAPSPFLSPHPLRRSCPLGSDTFPSGPFFPCPLLTPTSGSHQPSPPSRCLLWEPKNPLTSPLIDFLSHQKQKELLICAAPSAALRKTLQGSLGTFPDDRLCVLQQCKKARTVGQVPRRSQYESGSHAPPCLCSDAGPIIQDAQR